MRISLFSDLHLELWREHAPPIDIAGEKPDVVVLAGDIHTGTKAIAWAQSKFQDVPVVYVAGNHEAYGHNLEPLLDSLRSMASETPNVHFLDCAEFRHRDVRFLGATLWTDFELFGRDLRLECLHDAQRMMNDYRRIRLADAGYRKLRVGDTTRLHGKHRTWIQQKLDEPFEGKTVVVTHMAPSIKSIQEEYSDSIHTLSAAYASNLEHIVGRADLWLHGHTHHSVDYSIGKCRVRSNPCGYMIAGGKTENLAFDPRIIIDL